MLNTLLNYFGISREAPKTRVKRQEGWARSVRSSMPTPSAWLATVCSRSALTGRWCRGVAGTRSTTTSATLEEFEMALWNWIASLFRTRPRPSQFDLAIASILVRDAARQELDQPITAGPKRRIVDPEWHR